LSSACSSICASKCRCNGRSTAQGQQHHHRNTAWPSTAQQGTAQSVLVCIRSLLPSKDLGGLFSLFGSHIRLATIFDSKPYCTYTAMLHVRDTGWYCWTPHGCARL
jgi:hypothetical protein